MRVTRAILRLFLFFLTITPYIFRCVINKWIFKDYMRRNKVVRLQWIRLIVPILGLKVRLQGRMPSETCLIVSNHRSFSDPLIMLRHMDAFPLAKAEVNQYPFIGFGARITGILYVVREKASSRQGARTSIRDTLEKGQNVLIYAEGTTSKEEGTLPLKAGSLQVASSLGIPIVPVVIEYDDHDHHWLGRSLWQQYLLQFGGPTCACTLVIGEPRTYAAEGDYGVGEVRQWMENTIAEIRNSAVAD